MDLFLRLYVRSGSALSGKKSGRIGALARSVRNLFFSLQLRYVNNRTS